MAKQVVVYEAAGQLNADIIVAFLKSKGIECYSSVESIGSAFGLQGNILGRAEVYVHEEDEAEALRLLDAMDAGELVLSEGVDLTEQYQQSIPDDDILPEEDGVDPDDEEQA